MASVASADNADNTGVGFAQTSSIPVQSNLNQVGHNGHQNNMISSHYDASAELDPNNPDHDMQSNGIVKAGILHLSNLPVDIKEDEITKIFEKFNISKCHIQEPKGSSSLRAYLEFISEKDATHALHEHRFLKIRNNDVDVQIFCHPSSLSEKANVHIQNLDPKITRESLYDKYVIYGEIISLKIIKKKGTNVAYIQYKTKQAADAAIARTQNCKIGNEVVQVYIFQKKSDLLRNSTSEKYTNLFCKQFPRNFTEDQLKKLFEQFGTIVKCKRIEHGAGATFFCNFDNHVSAVEAIEALNGKYFRSDGSQVDGDGDNAIVIHKSLWSEDEVKNGASLELSNKGYIMYVTRHQYKAQRAESLSASHTSERNRKAQNISKCTLFIQSFPSKFTETDVVQYLSKYGHVDVSLKSNQEGKINAIVTFDSPATATEALNHLHLHKVNNEKLRVDHFMTRDQLNSKRKTHNFDGNQRNMRNWNNSNNQVFPPIYANGIGYNNFGPGPNNGYNLMTIPPGHALYNQYPGIPPYYNNPSGPNIPNNVGNMLPANLYGINNMGMVSNFNDTIPNDHAFVSGLNIPNLSHDNPPAMGHGINAGAMKRNFGVNMPRDDHQPSLPTEKKHIGNLIYPFAEKFNPKFAGKITGMLLDLDITKLKEILENPNDLRANIEKAYHELQRSMNEESVLNM